MNEAMNFTSTAVDFLSVHLNAILLAEESEGSTVVVNKKSGVSWRFLNNNFLQGEYIIVFLP
jgi:hypothetical protein